MILVYLAFAALIAAIAGLFIPKKLVFWCVPDDRNRAMAFTVYLTLAVVLTIVFIIVVPEPEPEPEPAPAPPVAVVKKPQPPALTQPMFLKEVKNRLGKVKELQTTGVELSLLSFGKVGATAQIKFAKRPHHMVAVEHGTHTVKAMVSTFEAHGWKLKDPMMVMAQVHTKEIDPDTKKLAHQSIGFARYRPSTKKITWLDYN